MTEAPPGERKRSGDLCEVALCLTCFSFRGHFGGKRHRCRCEQVPDDWAEVGEWAGYDMPLLIEPCRLCLRGTAQSGSRWTYFACGSCVAANRAVGEVLGSPHGALPLGRHSMMNGLDSRLGKSGFAVVLREMHRIWVRLTEWRQEEGQRLSESVGLVGRGEVAWTAWEKALLGSLGASADALCRLLDFDLPAHPRLVLLNEERDSFLGASP